MGLTTILIVVIYLMAVGYLGYRGFRQTKSAADYMVAGRNVHPFIMALSYGATFISTSAIVGFGGVAGIFGMSLLWLTFLNIFVGIFVAFVFLGGPTRRMGHHLDAHTFPELLGRRYDSKGVQMFAGLIIFLFIPLYSAAVLIGGCEFIATSFGIQYEVALLVFSVIIAAYVVMGGLKGVMYTDALQGSVMFIGMLLLLVITYIKVGGVTTGHQELTDLAGLVPGGLQSIGHRGWTAMPEFGWGGPQYDLWWIVISAITLGVGIGVLAQPQLAVRFMTVRSKKELNRAVLVGGIFILIMTGVAFTVGALSNAYFTRQGPEFTGVVVKELDKPEHAVIQLAAKSEETGEWALQFKPLPEGAPADATPEPLAMPVLLSSLPAEGGIGESMMVGGEPRPLVTGRTISVVLAKGNAGQIIPQYIEAAMPKWFGLVFLLTLLAAAMSTLSSQFHTLGTSIGRDVYETLKGSHAEGITVTRVGIMLGIVIAVVISWYWRGGTVIARATAIFFGLCGAAFLPAYVGGLFIRRMNRPAAIASMIVGFTTSALWLLLVKSSEASAIGLVQKLTGGKKSILEGVANWHQVDPVVIALPLSILTAIVVMLVTKPMDKAHVDYCYGGAEPTKPATGDDGAATAE